MSGGKKDEKKEESDKQSFAYSMDCNEDVKDEECQEESPNVVRPSRIEWVSDNGNGRHLAGNPTLLGEYTDKAGTLLAIFRWDKV
jgi:hypothetical protein